MAIVYIYAAIDNVGIAGIYVVYGMNYTVETDATP